MSASRFPTICACALVGCVVRAKTKAMNSDSNWYLLVSCSFIVSPLLDSETTLLARLGVEAFCLAFCRAWRELLEHLRHTLDQVLFILLGLAGQGVLGAAAPNQLLGFCVVHVDDQGSLLVVLFGRRRLAESSAPESSPTPSSTEAVIEGLK